MSRAATRTRLAGRPDGVQLRVRCHAHSSRTGAPCRQYAIRGGTVCNAHGGASGHVRRAADARLARLVDPHLVLAELARIAYSDLVTAVRAEDGTLRPISEWSEDVRRAVSRLVCDRDGRITDVRMWDKTRALELLARHLGLVGERDAPPTAVAVQIVHEYGPAPARSPALTPPGSLGGEATPPLPPSSSPGGERGEGEAD